jgi:DNA-binding response OmpR family regulator
MTHHPDLNRLARALRNRRAREGSEAVKQCAVLVINTDGREDPYRSTLQKVGFRVVETAEWPADEVIRGFEVVIVLLRRMEAVSMLAARLRAKPHFGQRVLIAVAPGPTTPEERRAGIGCGFDDVVSESRDARLLIARILRQLRARPEHRCFLPDLKRRAA